MKIRLYINSRMYGAGRHAEFVCTSDSTCLKFFSDRAVNERYALVYLKETSTGYCAQCIGKFLIHLRAMEKSEIAEAHIILGHFPNERTRKAIRLFLHAILRSAEKIIEDPEPDPEWMTDDDPDDYAHYEEEG